MPRLYFKWCHFTFQNGLALFMKKFIKSNFMPFVKYSIVGVFVTLLDLGFLYIFKEYFYFNVIVSSALAFIIANFTSFLLNKFWTFRNRSRQVIRQYIKFIFTSVVGLLLTVFFMWLFYEKLNLFHSFIEKNYLICKILTSGIVVIWNFLVNKFWTFSPALKLDYKSIKSEKKKYPYDLSIVIPAYNESNRIIDTILKITSYLKTIKLRTEIIIIDDGSSDGTYNDVQRIFRNRKNFKVIRNQINQGKGYSVRKGIFNSSGQYILFTDADNSTPIEELNKFIPYLDNNTILIGSRYKKSESTVIKKQPVYRIILSRVGNYLIRLFLSLDIEDTQCGFKLFPHEIADYLFRLQTINRFGFDMEILSLAFLSEIKVKEISVNWFDSAFTRVRPIKDAFITFIELLRIKINIWMKYYQKKAKNPGASNEAL